MTTRRGTLRGVLLGGQALIIFAICAALCGLEAEASPVGLKSKPKRCAYHKDTMDVSETAESKLISTMDGKQIQQVSNRIVPLRTGGRSKRYAVKGIVATEVNCSRVSCFRPSFYVMSPTSRGVEDPRILHHVATSIEEIWPMKDLTYKISSYPNKLQKIIIDNEIAKAFALRSEHTDLTFTPKMGMVNIEINFVRRDHGDGEPFAERIPGEKQGYKVAHIFSSANGTSVEVYFDKDEEWSINNNHCKSLLLAAAHVFGHALRLGHSTNRPSIMYPWNDGMDDVKLYDDDIVKIQALYGPKTPEEDPDLCKDPTFDTMFNFAEGDTYVFKALLEVNRGWRCCCGLSKTDRHIYAAFTDENGKTYFFKGSFYWMYFGDEMDQDSPRYINENFYGIPDDIDAATTMDGSERTWFAKDGEYWIFDPTQVPQIHSQYPKSISDLQGIPEKVNAVLNQQNIITFFDGERFYRHDKRTIR